MCDVCEFVVVAWFSFRCSRCCCRISLWPLPLQDFIAAVAGAGFCAAIAVPDHMTYESCDESGSWIVGGRVLLRPLLWQISLRSLPWQDFVAVVAMAGFRCGRCQIHMTLMSLPRHLPGRCRTPCAGLKTKMDRLLDNGMGKGMWLFLLLVPP